MPLTSNEDVRGDENAANLLNMQSKGLYLSETARHKS